MWCNHAADILEIEADGFATFEGLQKELTAIAKTGRGKIISKSFHQGKFQLIAKTCMCAGAGTDPIMAKHNFMEVPPTVLMGGWEHYRLVGFDDSDVKGLLRDLDKIGKIEVLHKKEIAEGVTDDAFLMSLSSLFGQLTSKQTKALLSAVGDGYFEIPKRTTAEEIAKRNGQPRSTFEEHVRKAESKIMFAITPYMMMYAKVPRSPLNTRTRAAGASVGARIMKQLTVQLDAENGSDARVAS
jgi:predicted DNA binding protein